MRTGGVGDDIRRLREARGLTQVALARRARIGRVTLARIEAGTQSASVPTLERLARALGVTVEVEIRFRRKGRRA